MTEVTQEQEQFEVDAGGLFDPANFVVNSALNGKQGAVQGGTTFIRHDYNGNIAEKVTALRVIVASEELEKPRVALVAAGDGTFPAVKVGEKDGKIVLKRAEEGPFVIGPISKRGALAEFIGSLRGSGFPVAELATAGFAAIDGGNFVWRAVEKTYGSSKNPKTKIADLPSQFLGRVEVQDGLSLLADVKPVEAASTSAAGGSATSAPIDVAAIREKVVDAITEALKAAPGNEIARGQLSMKVGPTLKFENASERGTALSLLLKDEVLSSVPGVTYDKKTVKLTA